jgi:hypothetical protein
VLALAAIFAMAGGDLNASDFISRGVEEICERYNKSMRYRHHEMETSHLRDIAAQTG